MIKRMYYMNDEKKSIAVRIMDDRYDPCTGTGDMFVNLQSCESRVFEVHCPAAHILYVKKWPNMVMISHIDPSVLALSSQPQPPEDAA